MYSFELTTIIQYTKKNMFLTQSNEIITGFLPNDLSLLKTYQLVVIVSSLCVCASIEFRGCLYFSSKCQIVESCHSSKGTSHFKVHPIKQDFICHQLSRNYVHA